MSNLSVLGYGEIRQTHDNRFSVFDTIAVVGGKRNPWDAWNAICQQFPEVLGKVEDFQFSGQGQRKTPVASKENILYVIGLLPGTVGRSYREDAAKLMCVAMFVVTFTMAILLGCSGIQAGVSTTKNSAMSRVT